MVTAILPAMTASPSSDSFLGSGTNGENTSLRNGPSSLSSDLTVTPARVNALSTRSGRSSSLQHSSPTKLAGFVGLFTGLGALVALGLFLPLLARLRKVNAKPGASIVYTYYIVALVAILVAIACLVGLRNVNGEENKGFRRLLNLQISDHQSQDPNVCQPYWASFYESLRLGIEQSLIGLGYLGGFVARASSVGISLFIPLYVNAYFISSGNCKDIVDTPSEIKSACPQAYLLAAQLTGVSQLVALIMAPAFGFLADRYRPYHLPLLLAALAGILGYLGLANLRTPLFSGDEGNPVVFICVSLIGISQIGCIVCSLGLIGRGILGLENQNSIETEAIAGRPRSGNTTDISCSSTHPSSSSNDESSNSLLPTVIQHGINPPDTEETTSLLGQTSKNPRSLNHLKGSIAGVYSFGGGAGILLLTKLGGYLFDRASNNAPFYMLAIFNLILLLATGLTAMLETKWACRGRQSLRNHSKAI